MGSPGVGVVGGGSGGGGCHVVVVNASRPFAPGKAAWAAAGRASAKPAAANAAHPNLRGLPCLPVAIPPFLWAQRVKQPCYAALTWRAILRNTALRLRLRY